MSFKRNSVSCIVPKLYEIHGSNAVSSKKKKKKKLF